MTPPNASATPTIRWISGLPPRTEETGLLMWGRCPQTPEIYRIRARMADLGAAFSPPQPFRPLSRRSSCVSAEPYPPLRCDQSTANFVEEKSEMMSVGRTDQAPASATASTLALPFGGLRSGPGAVFWKESSIFSRAKCAEPKKVCMPGFHPRFRYRTVVRVLAGLARLSPGSDRPLRPHLPQPVARGSR